MKKYVLGFVTGIVLLLLSINAYAIDVGFGAEVDDGDMELDLSIDWNREVGPWQTNIEFDFVTEETEADDEKSVNEVVKQIARAQQASRELIVEHRRIAAELTRKST